MTRKHTHRYTICLVAAAALAGGFSGSAAAGQPSGMGPDAYAALNARSEALNRLYRLGDHARPKAGEVPSGMVSEAYQALLVRSRALNDRHGSAATTMSAAEHRALYLRSAALNRRYGLGDYARSAPAPTPLATPSSGLDWVTPAIGGAAALGALLIAAAAVAGSRHHRHPPLTHSH